MDVIITAQEVIDWYQILWEKEIIEFYFPKIVWLFDYQTSCYNLTYRYMIRSFYFFSQFEMPLRVMIPFNGTYIAVPNYMSMMLGQITPYKANEMLAVPMTFTDACVILARPVPWDHEFLMALFFIFMYGALAGGGDDLYSSTNIYEDLDI